VDISQVPTDFVSVSLIGIGNSARVREVAPFMTPHDAHNRRFIIFARTRAFRITTTSEAVKNWKKYGSHPMCININKQQHGQSGEKAKTIHKADMRIVALAPNAEKRERAQLCRRNTCVVNSIKKIYTKK